MLCLNMFPLRSALGSDESYDVVITSGLTDEGLLGSTTLDLQIPQTLKN